MPENWLHSAYFGVSAFNLRLSSVRSAGSLFFDP